LVDDQQEYLESTRALLEREGHKVAAVLSGEEGLEILGKEHFDLLLVDYFMPHGITGEEMVNRLRKFNPYIQVILQTGYAGEIPPREMLRRLEIQGYHDKTDGPERLLMWVDIGLSAAHTVQLLYKSRLGLQYILDITPEMNRMQQSPDLFRVILQQAYGLTGIFNTLLSVVADGHTIREADTEKNYGFIATIEGPDLEIKAATGYFANSKKAGDCMDPKDLGAVMEEMQKKRIFIYNNFTIAPLIIGEKLTGMICLGMKVSHKQDMELLQVFVNQASVAIHNAREYPGF